MLAAFAGGCAGPVGYQSYAPAPVETERARAVVREVHRGRLGGVVTLEIENLSGDHLHEISGGLVQVQDEAGEVRPALSMREFQQRIDRHGGSSMGYPDWSRGRPEAMLDPLNARWNLATGETAVLDVGYEAPPHARRIVLDLAPAIRWRTSNGLLLSPRDPFLVAVELPPIKTNLSPAPGALSNVHVGVGVSSDDVIR